MANIKLNMFGFLAAGAAASMSVPATAQVAGAQEQNQNQAQAAEAAANAAAAAAAEANATSAAASESTSISQGGSAAAASESSVKDSGNSSATINNPRQRAVTGVIGLGFVVSGSDILGNSAVADTDGCVTLPDGTQVRTYTRAQSPGIGRILGQKANLQEDVVVRSGRLAKLAGGKKNPYAKYAACKVNVNFTQPAETPVPASSTYITNNYYTQEVVAEKPAMTKGNRVTARGRVKLQQQQRRQPQRPATGKKQQPPCPTPGK